jgi:hypothetical protein
VIEWLPATSAAVLKEAEPLVKLTVPINVAPFRNFTEPVGIPEIDGFTLAVKETVLPYTDGLSDEVIVVEVVSWTT